MERENFNIGITFIGKLTKLIRYICVYGYELYSDSGYRDLEKRISAGNTEDIFIKIKN